MADGMRNRVVRSSSREKPSESEKLGTARNQ